MGMNRVTVGAAVSLILAGCGGGGDGGSTSPTSVGPSGTSSTKSPVITLSASRTQINEVQTSRISWSVTDATSCTGGGSLSGTLSTNGTTLVSYSKGERTFEVKCTGSGGTSTKSVTVSGNPAFMDFAGAWYPATPDSLKDGYDGTIVGSFYNQVKIGNDNNYGIAVTGWGFKGWDSTSKETAKVNMALFEPQSNGLLRIATQKYISDPITNGGASVIIADVNKDQYQDIVLISHNETPIAPRASVVFFGSNNGTYSKRFTSDSLSAHDAQFLDDKVLTSVVTGHPRNAYYNFVNGDLNPSYTQNISYYNSNFLQLGNMSQTFISNKEGNKVLVTGGGCRHTTGACERTINTFSFDGNDITNTAPKQIVKPYLSTLAKYSSVNSSDGTGQTHVYRVWSLDLNKDGNKDVLSAQSMWHPESRTYPVALQVLINDGQNNLSDQSENLAQNLSTEKDKFDPSPSFIDIDNSGIETLFFANVAMNETTKHSNYVLLNDGTGKLHVALHDEFYAMTDSVLSIMKDKGYSFPVNNPDKSWQVPKFIVVPQQDGSVNFLAEVKTNHKNTNPDTGVSQNTHLFVNVQLNYNPAQDYSKQVVIKDRNYSKQMRTWAGDDEFLDKNAVPGTKIDGGQGTNKVIYSGVSSSYTVTKQNDGSYRVVSNTNNIDDTLIRMHNIVFSDKTITLE